MKTHRTIVLAVALVLSITTVALPTQATQVSAPSQPTCQSATSYSPTQTGSVYGKECGRTKSCYMDSTYGWSCTIKWTSSIDIVGYLTCGWLDGPSSVGQTCPPAGTTAQGVPYTHTYRGLNSLAGGSICRRFTVYASGFDEVLTNNARNKACIPYPADKQSTTTAVDSAVTSGNILPFATNLKDQVISGYEEPLLEAANAAPGSLSLLP